MAFDPSKYTVAAARPLPVILLLDRSGSMGEVESGDIVPTGETVIEDGKEYNIVTGGLSRIDILNQAVNEMIQSFKTVGKNEVEIDVGVISFGSSVNYDVPLQPARNITEMKCLEASGSTPMGTALRMAKDLIEDRDVIPSKGYRPMVILVSDGGPNDNWEEAMNAFVSDGRSAKCDRFALAIGRDADRDVLKRFLQGTENKLCEANDAAKIRNFFRFVTMTAEHKTLSSNPNLSLPPAESQEMLDEMGF